MQLSPALRSPIAAPSSRSRCRTVMPAASGSAPEPSTSGRPAPPPQQQQQQRPPGMMLGPNGRPLVMGPDGRPVEMVRMDERPEAFVGIAAMDKGENDNPSSAQRMALLAAGDLAVLLAFAAIGRNSHGEPVTVADTFSTALPFIIGWFASGAVLGGFSPDAQGGKAGAAAAAAAKTWVVGVPLGIVIRSISRGYVPAASFMGIAMGVTGLLMIGWRTALAAATPEAEQLTPAQQAARRKNKQGGLLDGLNMVMSLVKRW